MNPAISAFISLTLFCTMVALGISLELKALKHWMLHPAVPMRVLLCSCVMVPLVGLLLLQLPWSLAIPQPERTAIALMAVCPSAPLALRKTKKSGGDHQLAALVQISAAMCAIVSVPVLALLFKQTFSVGGWNVKPWDIALQVGQAQVAPLLLAIGLKTWQPKLSAWLNQPLDRLANSLLALLALMILIKAGPILMTGLISKAGAMSLMLLLVLASLSMGWTVANQSSSQRITTSLVTAMRNPGLALLLANQHGQGLPGLKAAILIYVVITLLLSWPLSLASQHES